MSKRERNMLPRTGWNKQKYKSTIRTQHSDPRVVAASAAWETWILGPVPSAGARKAGKLLNYYCSKNWSLILTVFRLWASKSLSLCVCLSLSVWMSSLPLCVCFFVCEFFCPVKHMFHSCGLTCHSLCFVCKWLSAYDTLSNYVLLLASILHSTLCVSLTRQVLSAPMCCIYVSVSPFMSLSFSASACFWHPVHHSICIVVYFSLCASRILSLYQSL